MGSGERVEMYVVEDKTMNEVKTRLRDLHSMWWALNLLMSFAVGYLLIGPVLEVLFA